MKIEVREAPFSAWEALQDYEQLMSVKRSKFGAIATFTGTMRDFNEGDEVRGMFLEHYPGMTEKYLEKIAQTAVERWELLDALVIHRVGQLQPGETIVLVATWAVHRDASFRACRYLIDELKFKAPFWKRETLCNKTRWVEKNTV